jgi:hypothetical protein
MLTLAVSTPELRDALVAVLRDHQISYSTAGEYAIAVIGPFTGDAYDVVSEHFYDAQFGKWCLLEFDNSDDASEFRSELVANRIPFVEEDNEGEQGIVVAQANAPI